MRLMRGRPAASLLRYGRYFRHEINIDRKMDRMMDVRKDSLTDGDVGPIAGGEQGVPEGG